MRHRDGFFAVLAARAAAEGRTVRAQLRELEQAQAAERRKGACLLCLEDEPSGRYLHLHWCRACGRTW